MRLATVYAEIMKIEAPFRHQVRACVHALADSLSRVAADPTVVHHMRSHPHFCFTTLCRAPRLPGCLPAADEPVPGGRVAGAVRWPAGRHVCSSGVWTKPGGSIEKCSNLLLFLSLTTLLKCSLLPLRAHSACRWRTSARCYSWRACCSDSTCCPTPRSPRPAHTLSTTQR